MAQDFLNEREFELVNIVGAQLAQNQRALSRQMKMSLGMTNMLLRRLVSKGYIRIQQLNSRKVHYILTPKGFAEKMNKSIKYTLKTINSISLIKNRLRGMITQFHGQGHKEIWILGTSDLALLIEAVAQEQKLTDCKLHYIDQWRQQTSSGVLLICKEDVAVDGNGALHVVNVVHELAKDEYELTQR